MTTEPGKLVRMRVTSGFPFWQGSTWEWELGTASRTEAGTSVLFRHYGFADGYAEIDLGHTAQTGGTERRPALPHARALPAAGRRGRHDGGHPRGQAPRRLLRLGHPLMSRQVRKSITADLERLRACLEQ